jgi:hypothetical protein
MKANDHRQKSSEDVFSYDKKESPPLSSTMKRDFVTQLLHHMISQEKRKEKVTSRCLFIEK